MILSTLSKTRMTFLNSDKFISRLDNKNTMNIDLTVDIISFGFTAGKGFWTVNLGARSIISASIPKVCLNLPVTLIDPDSFEELNTQYDIRDMELRARYFH